jgi:hypothetical protein
MFFGAIGTSFGAPTGIPVGIDLYGKQVFVGPSGPLGSLGHPVLKDLTGPGKSDAWNLAALKATHAAFNPVISSNPYHVSPCGVAFATGFVPATQTTTTVMHERDLLPYLKGIEAAGGHATVEKIAPSSRPCMVTDSISDGQVLYTSSKTTQIKDDILHVCPSITHAPDGWGLCRHDMSGRSISTVHLVRAIFPGIDPSKIIKKWAVIDHENVKVLLCIEYIDTDGCKTTKAREEDWTLPKFS